MYKKRLDINAVISEIDLLADMKDGDVFQITQKGQETRVMMTQEYFFQLMARLEKVEETATIMKYDATELMNNFENLKLSERDFNKVINEIENSSMPNEKLQMALGKIKSK